MLKEPLTAVSPTVPVGLAAVPPAAAALVHVVPFDVRTLPEVEGAILDSVTFVPETVPMRTPVLPTALSSVSVKLVTAAGAWIVILVVPTLWVVPWVNTIAPAVVAAFPTVIEPGVLMLPLLSMVAVALAV